MKVLFIEARKNFKVQIEAFKELDNLPPEVHILYTIQYKELAGKIKKYLENKKHKIVSFQQVLGCSKIKPKTALLLVGSGKFHALQLALSTGKEVYIFDNKLSKISKEEIELARRQEKGKLAKFLASNNIGVIFSNKPGQAKSLSLIKELEKKFPGKNFYPFISDSINISELENFPIDIWINAACPGIEQDSNRIINYTSI